MRFCLPLVLIALALAACGGENQAGDASTAPANTTAAKTTAAETESGDEATGESVTAETGEIDPAAEGLAELARAWYASADPAVCERMTNRLLRFGWKKTGKAGVTACRHNLEQADPVKGVRIVEATVEGDKAEVTVAYVNGDVSAQDRIHFVRKGGSWKMDEVAVVVDDAA